MTPKAHGRILFCEGASLWILSAPPGTQYPKTDVHAHHVVQISLALIGRVDFDSETERVGGVAIAIAPNAPHAFQGTGLVAHLFVAPEGRAGRQIARGLFSNGPIAAIPTEQLGDLPAQLRTTFENPRHTDDDLRAIGRKIITTLAGERTDLQPRDPRIAKVFAWVTPRLDQPVTLDDIAKLIHLSPGRTRHLFVEQTGLPFRTYLLWLRLVRAVEIFANGAPLTDAAHGAGFADSAHFSRTFRRMFGIAAVSLRIS
jgi:AraC-like DNA-binding protein